MKKKKLNLAEAQKILEAVSKGECGNLPEAVVKEAMKLLMEAVMASHEQQAAAPRPIPPELPCPWRHSHALQEARLKVPEPCHCEGPVVRCILQEDTPLTFWQRGEPVDMEPIKISEFKKKLFTDGGARFWAWTADGKTPIFPIPI